MHNVSFSFELMQDGDLEKPKPRPEGDIKLLSASRSTGDNLEILVMNKVLLFCVSQRLISKEQSWHVA